MAKKKTIGGDTKASRRKGGDTKVSRRKDDLEVVKSKTRPSNNKDVPDEDVDSPESLGSGLSPQTDLRCNVCVVPLEFGQQDNQQSTHALSNSLTEDDYAIHDLVMSYLGNDYAKLSRKKVGKEEKGEMIKLLKERGYSYSIKDYPGVINIVRDVKNRKEALASCRHGSLNNYDYDRLKAEYASLSKLLGKRIETLCPTLKRIVDEAEATSNEPYPGRHLPFDSVKGKIAWRYQCLRIMDELLCTSDEPITAKQMEQYIFDKAEELKIQPPQNIVDKKEAAGRDECVLDGSLKRNYVILDELISVEHNAGARRKYESSVYTGGRRGHLYKQINPHSKTDSERVSAFKVVFSYEEALSLKKELGNVRVNYFDDDQEAFAEQYPLLGVLHDYDKFATAQAEIDGVTNKLSYGDMVTVNYLPSELSGLKKQIKKTIESGMPLAVQNGKRWDNFLPIKINEKGKQWALLAKNIETGHLQQISPEFLQQTFKSCRMSENNVSTDNDYSDNIIGLSPLIDGRLWDIMLELTDQGSTYVMKDTSEFKSLSPSVAHSRPRYYRETKVDRVSFMAYLNDDILDEFLTLDSRGQLIDILPEEVMHLYEDYYFKQQGKKRLPLSERGYNTKRVRRNKKKARE